MTSPTELVMSGAIYSQIKDYFLNMKAPAKLTKEFRYSTYDQTSTKQATFQDDLNFKIVVVYDEKIVRGILGVFDSLGRCVYSLQAYDVDELQYNIKKMRTWLAEQKDEIDHFSQTLDQLETFATSDGDVTITGDSEELALTGE